MKHTAFSMAVAAALMGAGAMAQAAPAVVAGTGYGPTYSYGPNYVQYAPPAPMYEPTPAPRAGYTWTSGHYEWRNGQYVWIPGRWMEARPGYVWQEALSRAVEATSWPPKTCARCPGQAGRTTWATWMSARRI